MELNTQLMRMSNHQPNEPVVITKRNIALGGLLLGAVLAAWFFHRSSIKRVQDENRSLRVQVAELQSSSDREKGSGGLRLSSPRLKGTGTRTQAEAADTKAAELAAQFKVPKLSIEQVEKFLAGNQRSAASLVAAFRTSGESAFLTEAMQKYPNDPQVAFEALFHGNLAFEERRNWIDSFKQSDPDNPLANYLAAQDYFKSGQGDLAFRELEAASRKSEFNDLTLSRMQFNEEAYRANGFSEAQSRSVAMFQLDLPLLKEMKSLGENMLDLARSYREAGDVASFEAAVAMAVNLGRQYRNSGNALLVHQMLGFDIEQSALNVLDPASPFGPDGRTAQDLLNSLKSERSSLSGLLRETVHLQEQMTPQDWIGYIDRMKLLGEANAMRWLRSKYGSSSR